jgi:hypothetical protein
MPIPATDQDMIEAVRAFVDEYDVFPFFSDDDPDSEHLHELWDEWRETDRDLPTPMMIEARFGSMLNAFFLAGPWKVLAENAGERDPERPGQAISPEMFPTMRGAMGMPDITFEPTTTRALVANGIISLAWRNGPIEAVHGGGGPEAIEDGDMMRINASICRAVCDAISGEDLFGDLLAARRAILDPRRVLPTGETIWELAEGYVREVIDHANGEIAGLAAAGSAREPRGRLPVPDLPRRERAPLGRHSVVALRHRCVPREDRRPRSSVHAEGATTTALHRPQSSSGRAPGP